MTTETDNEFIERVVRTRTHGIAISLDDVDRLVAMASGKKIVRRKRCNTCNGEGKRKLPRLSHDGWYHVNYKCDACNGTGYKVTTQ